MAEQKILNHREKIESLLPHFLVAGVFVIFLLLNFLYYRRNNIQKYQRKIEKRAQELMSFTPRRITSMMRYSEFVRPVHELASNYGSKAELDKSDSGSLHMVSSAAMAEDGASIGPDELTDNDRDCASVRQTSLPVPSKGNDYKPRPRYTLPPLMFASPGRNKPKNKNRRELDIL